MHMDWHISHTTTDCTGLVKPQRRNAHLWHISIQLNTTVFSQGKTGNWPWSLDRCTQRNVIHLRGLIIHRLTKRNLITIHNTDCPGVAWKHHLYLTRCLLPNTAYKGENKQTNKIIGSDGPKVQQLKIISQNSKKKKKNTNLLLASISCPQQRRKVNKLAVWTHFIITKNNAREAICRNLFIWKIERRLKNLTMTGLIQHRRTQHPEHHIEFS